MKQSRTSMSRFLASSTLLPAMLFCGLISVAQAQVEPPPVITPPPSQPAPANSPTPTSSPPAGAASVAEQSPQAVAAPAITRSLFFSPEQLRNLNYAINVYRRNFQGKAITDEFDEEDFLSKLSNIKQTPETTRYFQYPQFYLESLVYHAEDNWIVWVNGQKITQATPSEHSDLKVEAINQDSVQLIWRPADSQKVMEIWKNVPRGEDVKVMGNGAAVRFSLRPNQTFSSYVMRVLEGKVKPVTVDTQVNLIPPESANEQDADSNPPEGDPSASDESSSGQGLGGLIGAYRRLGDTSGTEEKPAAPPAASAPAAP